MEEQPADYGSYTLEDLIDDPSFILWVTTPNNRLDIFWQQVQDKHPQLKPLIADARRIVLSLRFKSESMEPAEQQALWLSITASAKLNEKPAFRFSFWLRSAAAVLLIGLLLSLFLYDQQRKIAITTTFGQLKTLVLPDGSVVTLNANSQLRYPKNWNTAAIREVWIEGEAFFKVNHLHRSGEIKTADRFIVHAEKLNVEVLGTSFNVNNRRGLVKVALVTGKIGLKVKGLEADEIRLRPGELAVYREKEQHITKRTVYAQDYVSWKNGELHFNNTPLREVLALIEDNYGYKAVLKDAATGDRKLSGTFLFSSEDALLKAISTSLGISIQKDKVKHQLIIQ